MTTINQFVKARNEEILGKIFGVLEVNLGFDGIRYTTSLRNSEGRMVDHEFNDLSMNHGQGQKNVLAMYAFVDAHGRFPNGEVEFGRNGVLGFVPPQKEGYGNIVIPYTRKE